MRPLDIASSEVDEGYQESGELRRACTSLEPTAASTIHADMLFYQWGKSPAGLLAYPHWWLQSANIFHVLFLPVGNTTLLLEPISHWRPGNAGGKQAQTLLWEIGVSDKP